MSMKRQEKTGRKGKERQSEKHVADWIEVDNIQD